MTLDFFASLRAVGLPNHAYSDAVRSMVLVEERYLMGASAGVGRAARGSWRPTSANRRCRKRCVREGPVGAVAGSILVLNLPARRSPASRQGRDR
jgi:hypothetical protein